MKTLFEVGHFEAAGIPWKEAHKMLQGTYTLVHIKDVAKGESVRYGRGQVEFPALFRQLRSDRYDGNIVVEIETREHDHATEWLAEALEHVIDSASVA